MTESELIDEIMDYVETRRMSQLARKLAQLCRKDRQVLAAGAIYSNYLSDEENAFDAVSSVFEISERESLDREEKEKHG